MSKKNTTSTRDLNDYTANLPESKKQEKEKPYIPPKKVDRTIHIMSPMESSFQKKRTDYVVG